jgi:hypothetical protein
MDTNRRYGLSHANVVVFQDPDPIVRITAHFATAYSLGPKRLSQLKFIHMSDKTEHLTNNYPYQM